MSFNSKYTGAQVEELFGKIPIANDIWHSGNFNPSNYLPLRGGSIHAGSTTTPLILDTNDSLNRSIIIFQGNEMNQGQIGYAGASYGVWLYNFNSSSYLGIKDDGTPYYNQYTLWHSGNDGSSSGLDADLLDGKQPSELNVGSATKLQTARTIWGQSFDGTKDITGSLYVGGDYGVFLNKDQEGIYLTGAGINWHNSRNVWTNSIIRFDKDGNVSIGATSFSYKLDVGGDIHASGSITQNSDINLKNISKDILISLDDISEAPLFEFTYKSDKNKRIHVGTSAQYWVEKNNWFCKKQDNGYYDMEIQNLALASSISIAKEFKKYKEETESTISNMKKEIKELKQIILNMNK